MVTDWNFDWPADGRFSFRDEPGEHDPCYVVMPCGAMLPINHHATPGVDIARAKFIVAACNAALACREAVGDALDALAAVKRWRVKDYADGWIEYPTEAEARASEEAKNGALVEEVE